MQGMSPEDIAIRNVDTLASVGAVASAHARGGNYDNPLAQSTIDPILHRTAGKLSRKPCGAPAARLRSLEHLAPTRREIAVRPCGTAYADDCVGAVRAGDSGASTGRHDLG